jgi:prepilin-type N-terminal cleavage/methylation domain-containing protein
MKIGTHRHMTGFSLLELSVVLAVLGALTLGLGSQWESLQAARQHNAALAELSSARAALYAYVLRNRRLPCPAAESDHGFAPDPCPAERNRGLLPHASLGLDPPSSAPLYYAVHRGAGVDLVKPASTRHNRVEMAQRAGIETALTTLARRTTADVSQPHHPATPAAVHNDDCSPARAVNPAFLLLAPVQAVSSSAAASRGFDGQNQPFVGGTSLCSAAPERPRHAHYDDLVLSEPAAALLGWILQRAR